MRRVSCCRVHTSRWSCRLAPTPARSATTAMPCRRSSASGPMPDSISSCGELIEPPLRRSEEHTSELQSLMRISYAVFCLKKKKKKDNMHENISREKKEHKH